jgi:hypothetical protein
MLPPDRREEPLPECLKNRSTEQLFYTVTAKGSGSTVKDGDGLAEKIPDETRLLKAVIENLSCDDPEARRKALTQVMVFAWKPGWRPDGFIALKGIPALVGMLQEEDEKARVQAVEAVEHLAELGAAPELIKAGALPLLERMAAGDRYEPLRMIAGRAIARIRGRKNE